MTRRDIPQKSTNLPPPSTAPPQPQANEPTKRKIGEGVAQAALRHGANELADNIVPAFPEQSTLVSEPGQLFSPPSQAVSQQTGFSQPVSYVDQHHQQMTGGVHGQQQAKETTSPNQQPEMEIDP